MKIKQMQQICDAAQINHGCVACILFNTKVPGGCLKNYKYEITEKYNSAKAQKNDILASKIMTEYQQLEKEVLDE